VLGIEQETSLLFTEILSRINVNGETAACSVRCLNSGGRPHHTNLLESIDMIRYGVRVSTWNQDGEIQLS